MLPRISPESAPDLGRLRVPLELIDLPPLPDRLAVHGILEPFDHGLEMRKTFLHALETLHYRRILSAGTGGSAGRPSTRADLGHDALEHAW
jgi:hypothetical protein